MSKHIAAIPLNAIERIAIVFGGGRSMAQIKGDADYIMNGGYFNMETGKPVCHLKVDGKVYAEPPADDYWNDWGYTWNTNDIRLAVIPNDSTGKNHITATRLLAGSIGPTSKLQYSEDKAGPRQRTAMALTEDSLILYCTNDGTTPEQLRDELVAVGAVSALMLDGGASSQCDFMGEIIEGGREVNNFIAVWLHKTGDAPEEGENTMSKKVVLDPGHGVETAGKRSPDGTYLEHEFTLDMAFRIKPLLERHGVKVVLTRSDEHNITNYDRAEIANKENPDLVVSLHSNAAGSGADWMDVRGFGIYTSMAGDAAGRNIAARAILARAEEAGIPLWGDGLFHEGWTVLTKTVAPAVLIEHLFHDNWEDVALLKDNAYRDKLAEVDAKGILDYLGITWQDKPAEGGIVCPHCGGSLKIVKG